MARPSRAEREQILRALKRELSFFEAGGYGHPFRSQWRPTLLLRDSPVCVNFNATGRQLACRLCPLFPLVPPEGQNAHAPCHSISLDSSGITIARLYLTGSQKALDERYREWLCNLIQEFERH